MKLKHFLPLLFVAISFTACIERTERITTTVNQKSISPEYTVETETLKNRISAIVPSKNVTFSSSITEQSGEAEYHTLGVEIVSDSLPNGFSFFRITDEIRGAVESGIGNLEDYQKMEIVVRQTDVENGVERSLSYKKEIDL